MLLPDVRAIYQRDPAAQSWLEVLLCYPGVQALWLHRLAHWLYCFNVPFLPRLISQVNRFFTGIEIHPGAQIGRGVFIDHGIGVVIGETAIVGDYATIYQDVTLGGTGKETGKRHPTLGKNVVVGAGAKVLGNIHIGENVRIGAASVVLRDVPSDCTVVGIPGRISLQKSDALDALGHNNLRDIEAEVIQALFKRVKALEEKLEQLEPQSSPRSLGQVEAAQSNAMIEEFLNGAGI
ncbi:MAG: serine O-acetyltransferase [Plectolyngbya sp. WJT66-NPBG17]|jgi:serine O-acetyltransferase|nr:serine O-acetyltransferase [Plectolyngbya sp. WJT66-NPBG17]